MRRFHSMKTANTGLFFGPLAAALFAMSGCAVKTVPPTHYYTLSQTTPGIDRLALKTPLADSIRIVTSHATKLTEGTQIYYLTKRYMQQPYAFSRWYDSVDTMMENKLLAALKRADIAKSLLPAATSADARMVLEIDIVDFVQDFSAGATPTAKITLLATLIDNRTGKSLATRLFESKTACKSADAAGGVAALNEAADRIVLRLVGWLEEVQRP